jgi:hypothetical protein
MGEMEERKGEEKGKRLIISSFSFFLSPFLLISFPPFLPLKWQDKKKYQKI